jgi:ATP-binding cassette, subfamily C (CFTR/MRP), member 1
LKNFDNIGKITEIHFQSLTIYLQTLHKSKGHHASKFLFVFWFLLAFCAIPQLRSEVLSMNIDFSIESNFWNSYHFISYTIFFALISLMTILSAFSDKAPKHSTLPKPEKISPELSAGALNQFFFSWFSVTTWTGFKRPLTDDDIYDVNPQYASSEVTPIFDKNFKRSVDKNAKKSQKKAQKEENTRPLESNGSVLSALWKSFGSQLMISLFLRIIIDLMVFAQPFLLGLLK